MVVKFFGGSAVAVAAMLVGTMPALAHDGGDKLCGGVMQKDKSSVMTRNGSILMLGSSGACPEAEQVASLDTTPVSEDGGDAATTLAALPHDGLVYFSLDSADLDAEDQAMLDDIITAVKTSGPSKVVVRGHADRSGSDDYNMALSERRAQTIAAALIAAGVPADSVRTMGRGETELAVVTEDGVAMRQNRRAAVSADE